ncbi:MAG: hypothetical protein MJ233_04725 [Mycoplasmoidaceae bacterium]|nr:hypothetical protein [Mycoplasmoidaceae bacterium]
MLAVGITFEFDDANKCYTATVSSTDTSATYTLYFANKKLVKMCASLEGEGSKTESIFEFSYEKANPQLPHNPKLGDGDIKTAMEEAISLANIDFAQAFIEHYGEGMQPTVGETQLSPSVFYENSIEGSKGNAKEYVVKNEKTIKYTKISRSSETSEWQKEEAGEEEFTTVQKMGQILTNLYSASMALTEDPYQYDDQEECYRKRTEFGLFR